MPVPPPLHDPSHVEARLLIVAEMLDRAVEEVRRAMAEIKSGPDVAGGPLPSPEPDVTAGEPDADR